MGQARNKKHTAEFIIILPWHKFFVVKDNLTDAWSLFPITVLLTLFCFIKHSAAAALNSRSKYTESVARIRNLYDVMF